MNDTSLTFNISYSITESELEKIASIVPVGFCLVPILNGVDIHTYTNIDGSATTKSFSSLFTSWGSSFIRTAFITLAPEWTYEAITAGTNTISFTTGYGQYLFDETSLDLATNIQFAVYAWNKADNVPTGNRLTTIDYSDIVSVSCTFKKAS